MKILVDMDDVLADFEGHFLATWRKLYPDKFYIPLEERRVFFIEEEYPPELQGLTREIMDSPGFYLSLPEKKGAIDAVLEMQKKHDVLICSSPRLQSKYCIPEKYAWISEHLGKEWMKKLIITTDKTKELGNILIDDKPIITGSMTPSWEHVLYDMPYNRSITGKRRITWQNWRDVLRI